MIILMQFSTDFSTKSFNIGTKNFLLSRTYFRALRDSIHSRISICHFQNYVSFSNQNENVSKKCSYFSAKVKQMFTLFSKGKKMMLTFQNILKMMLTFQNILKMTPLFNKGKKMILLFTKSKKCSISAEST